MWTYGESGAAAFAAASASSRTVLQRLCNSYGMVSRLSLLALLCRTWRLSQRLLDVKVDRAFTRGRVDLLFRVSTRRLSAAAQTLASKGTIAIHEHIEAVL